MKKHLKRMIVGKNGSISIFAAIIILPIFLLNALFIDTLRILSADRQLENAIESSLRSVMSYYDPDLSSVGLFSYAGSNVENQFIYYLERQFPQELDGYMNLTIPKINKNNIKVKIHNDRNLVNLDVFRHQVLESSKYQAPVQLGKDFIELIMSGKGVSKGDLDKVEELVENYEELLDLIDKRNKKIDRALTQYSDLKEVVTKKIPNDILGDIPKNPDKIPKGIKKYGDLIGYHDRYQELKKKNKDDEEDPLTESEEDEIEYYEEGLDKNIYTKIQSIIDNDIFAFEITNHLVGVGSPENPSKDSAMWYNNEINKFFDGSPQLREEFEEFMLKDEFFKVLVENLDLLKKELTNKDRAPLNEENLEDYSISQLYISFYAAIKLDSKHVAEAFYYEMKSRMRKLKKIIEEEMDKQVSTYKKIKDKLESIDEKEKNEAEANFGDMWKILNDLNALADDQGEYDELLEYLTLYEGWGEDSSEPTKPGIFQFVKEAIARFKAFVEFIEGFPESYRNEIYINEYILANYGTSEPYVVFGKMPRNKKDLKDIDVNSFKSQAFESFLYENKKAEYITYGYHKPAANYARFLLDITLLLFVVNLSEHITKGRFGGVTNLWVAFASAFVETFNELEELTSNGSIRWSPFKMFKTGKSMTKVDMKMFLRIMMAIRSSVGPAYNDGKIRRLQAVVSKENNINLIEASTYVETKVEGRIDLLFIPALMNFLPNSNGGIQGNQYIIRKEKIYSY